MIRSYGSLAVHGNINFKDCHMMAVQWSIVGPNYDENMVSFTNCTAGNRAEIGVSNGARVRFTDFESEGSDESNYLSISDSHAIFERASFWTWYEGYQFQNSTVIASDTWFSSDHSQFSASNSFLNLTNSSVIMGGGNWNPGISISRCSVKATCGLTAGVFSTGSSSYGTMGMDIDDSTLSFENCSCHLDHAISVAGPLSIRNSSNVTFSSCQIYGGATKADPVVVVV